MSQVGLAPVESLRSVDHGPSDLAVVIAAGGLMTTGLCLGLYHPLLRRDRSTNVPPRRRFLPPPFLGVAPPDKIRTRLIDQLERLHEQLDGRKMRGVGHSEGGLLITDAAMERPHLFDAVDLLGSVHKGIVQHTFAGQAIRQGVGLVRPREKHLLDHESGHIQEHITRMGEEWPADTPVQIFATSIDILNDTAGFDVKLARGQRPTNFLLRPTSSALEMGIRRSQGLSSHPEIPEGVNVVRAGFVDHFNMPMSSFVIEQIYRARAERAGYSDNLAILSPTPSLPETAAA